MAKRTTNYRTRDPQPTNRDPQPANAEATMPRCAGVLMLHYTPPTCTKCGHGVFREGNATRPNYTTGQMTRRKTCAHCGQRFMFVNDPTADELKKYWPDRDV